MLPRSGRQKTEWFLVERQKPWGERERRCGWHGRIHRPNTCALRTHPKDPKNWISNSPFFWFFFQGDAPGQKSGLRCFVVVWILFWCLLVKYLFDFLIPFLIFVTCTASLLKMLHSCYGSVPSFRATISASVSLIFFKVWKEESLFSFGNSYMKMNLSVRVN